MAILHIVANHLAADASTKLVERSSTNDGYVFIDDGVYTLLGTGLAIFGARDVFVLAGHVEERGLNNMCSASVKLVDMSGLVKLTASYASSMSW
jgi:sulfur relay protein TusB/DsrH